MVVKVSCIKCKREISKSNFSKHEISCDGTLFYGPINPNKKKHKNLKPPKPRIAWNKGLSKLTDERVKNHANSIKKAYEVGKLKPQGICLLSTETRREMAIRNNSGGYKERSGRSKKYYVYDSFNKKTCLQSSYEYRLYEILNNKNIVWVRPKPLKYGNKKYFADFFLPKYNLYLDTKNDYLIIKDAEKISKVIKENKINLLVVANNQINEEYIGSILQW